MKPLPSPSKPSNLSRTQRGVTLLEVLISIIVLSVGLLGYAGLQTVSLKNNTSAFQRSQATMLTYDIVDRMRAVARDPDPAVLGGYNVAMGSLSSKPDVIDWQNNVSNALPDGQASIAVPLAAPGAPTVATITIQWDDNRDGTDPIEFITQTIL
ncbi:MAG: type IV pilus modification protein PilV [Thiobacillus sp.]|nr:type IV pilus modification protein PilV [Thiobacillus sp.]